MNTNSPKHYRIISDEGEHVATVKPEFVAENLDFYNSRRSLDIDGNPMGEYTAVPFDGPVKGDS
jgi:hypothetical protein